MADNKFSCPHCGQHISAGAAYAGLSINCPSCNGSLVVPGEGAPAASTISLSSRSASPPPPEPVTPTALQTTAKPAANEGCPSCGNALPRGAVLCTRCGYNLATGQRTVAGRPAALGKPNSGQWETPWYKSAYPYVGAVLLLTAILYFLGRSNPAMMLACILLAALYTLIIHIIVIVAAFKEGVGTGLLTLFLPFYSFYFVFRVYDGETLKVLYATAALINIALRFLPEPAA